MDVLTNREAANGASVEHRRVLVMSTTTGYQLRSFADAAERLRIELVYATDRCHELEDPWQDAAIAVRFYDEDGSLRHIVESLRQVPVAGVIAVGDRPTVLAARVAEALRLQGNPPDAARASVSKPLTRERFAAAGLRVPWFRVIPPTSDPLRLTRDPDITFPAVVKPIALSGSRGVIRADTPTELAAALKRLRALVERREVRALRSGLDTAILVEGFIEGREHAIEGVLTDGVFQMFAIFDKPDPLDGPFFEETIYLTPSDLPTATQTSIREHVERGARALGLRHGPVHAECRVSGPDVALLEIAARPIGGLCSRVLRFRGGAALEEILLRHAVGENVVSYQLESAGAGVMMIPIPRRGVLKRVEGMEAARDVSGIEDVRITAKVGQLLEPLPEGDSYLGFIFARASSAREAEAAIREAHRRLTTTIDTPIDVAAR